MSLPSSYTYDREAKALYVYVGDEALTGANNARVIDHQTALSDCLILDVSPQGSVIGVEVLGVEWDTS